MNLIQQAFAHAVPKHIQRFPQGLRVLHAFQSLLYSRNATIARAVKRATHNFRGVLLDLGSGDGHFLFQLKNVRAHRVIALDRNADWMRFMEDYQARHGLLRHAEVEFHCADLDGDFLSHQTDVSLIFCFSVLPYVSDPGHVFARLAKIARPGAQLLLYTPVDFQTVLPLYRWMFKGFQHYESMQMRRALHSSDELTAIAKKHGFVLASSQKTYGFLGKIGHECWSISTMLLGADNPLWQVLGAVSIPLTMPLTVLLGFLDRRLPIQHGNGWMAQFVLLAEPES